jgi:hypothetical protein
MPRLTRQEFEDKLALMLPGEKVCYHTGSIMHDRLVGEDFGKVNNVAHAAFVACEKGIVHLTQRRVKGDQTMFDYLAVKKPPPYKPIEWEGAYAFDRMAIKRPQPARTENLSVRKGHNVGGKVGSDQPA